MEEAHAACGLRFGALFIYFATWRSIISEIQGRPLFRDLLICCSAGGRGFLNKETRSKSKELHSQGNFGRGVRRIRTFNSISMGMEKAILVWEPGLVWYSDRWKGGLLMREETSNS